MPAIGGFLPAKDLPDKDWQADASGGNAAPTNNAFIQQGREFIPPLCHNSLFPPCQGDKNEYTLLSDGQRRVSSLIRGDQGRFNKTSRYVD
jgi:hypothetical protein